ncbi:hypothetical protein VTK26DRAFT_9294 [Humicola hyalothermophila]
MGLGCGGSQGKMRRIWMMNRERLLAGSVHCYPNWCQGSKCCHVEPAVCLSVAMYIDLKVPTTTMAWSLSTIYARVVARRYRNAQSQPPDHGQHEKCIPTSGCRTPSVQSVQTQAARPREKPQHCIPSTPYLYVPSSSIQRTNALCRFLFFFFFRRSTHFMTLLEHRL